MLRLRNSHENDIELILKYIKDLASEEGRLADVTITHGQLRELLFTDASPAKCLIAEVEQNPIGYVVYYPTVSTFSGKKGVYIEDLYIDPTHRQKGYATSIIQELGKTCERLKWWCHKDNSAAIGFYNKIKAEAQDDFVIYHLD